MSKIYYCPRCGRLVEEDSYKIVNWCDCGKQFCLFSTKLLPMEEEYESFDLDQPMTFWKFTKEMHDLAFDKYVFNPRNRKVNKSVAKEYRASIEEFFASGEDHNPRHIDLEAFVAEQKRQYELDKKILRSLKSSKSIHCPCCLSTMITTRTSCFDPAGAVIGASLFGEPGAVFGAMGEERTYHVCQKCGYKWEPGKQL